MEYVESGTPVIRIGNILSNGTVDDELRNYVRVYEKVNADFPQTVIQKDDIQWRCVEMGQLLKELVWLNRKN